MGEGVIELRGQMLGRQYMVTHYWSLGIDVMT